MTQRDLYLQHLRFNGLQQWEQRCNRDEGNDAIFNVIHREVIAVSNHHSASKIQPSSGEQEVI